MKIKEGGGMDIQNFIAEFKKTFVYDLLSMTLKDEQLFEHMVDGDAVLWFKEQTRQMWLMWEKAKAQAVPDGYKVVPANYECVWCGCTELDGWTDETMIEAQEPSHE